MGLLILDIYCRINFFAGVHDSFWTHACDVEKMNRILREKFVELYNKPILENVSISLPTNKGHQMRAFLDLFWTRWRAILSPLQIKSSLSDIKKKEKRISFAGEKIMMDLKKKYRTCLHEWIRTPLAYIKWCIPVVP